jgi:uncharacterized membrane protein YfcA
MTAPEVTLAGLPLWALLYALAAVFVAGLVRGYSGFGLSALIVTSLALVVPPVEVVPVAMFLEVAASAGMVRLVWRDVAWPATRLLLAAACLGTPLGVLLLTALPADAMRVVISLLVLGASLALWSGLRLRASAGRGAILGTGLVSGVVNGSAAVGGLPIVLYFLSASGRAAAVRATMTIYLMFLSGYGLAVAAWSGLVTFEVLLRGAIFCLPLAFGLALGNHRFLRTSPESFRRFALGLLMVLSLLGLLRAALG